MKLRISDYCLIVPNVDRAVAFYGETLGLPMRFRNENFADFELGDGARLALWEHSHVSEALGGGGVVGKPGNRFMGAIRFDTGKEVDAAYEELEGKGVNFLTAPTDWPWGARAAYFKDPHGYLWEIYAWIQEPRTL